MLEYELVDAYGIQKVRVEPLPRVTTW